MADEPKITVEGNLEESAFGGGYTAGTNRARELSSWRAPIVSADMEINRDKPVLDARVKDMVRNEGYMQGAVDVHRDSIVGAQYVLNAQPNYKVLGADEKWAEEFQRPQRRSSTSGLSRPTIGPMSLARTPSPGSCVSPLA